jgi:hypothetical protein
MNPLEVPVVLHHTLTAFLIPLIGGPIFLGLYIWWHSR